MDWARRHLAQSLTPAVLARHAHMSTRTFHRRFAAETRTSPKRWIADQRVAAARELLESTDLTIEQVGAQAGFASTAALRGHLHRHAATSPTDYRRTFRNR